MKFFMARAGAIALLALLVLPTSGAYAGQKKKGDQGSGSTSLSDEPKPGDQKAGGPAVSKEELAAYKAVYEARGGDPAKLVELGEAFVMKYPDSIYVGPVYSDLANAYLHTNQPDKMIDAGTKALDKNPDNVDVLPMMSWALARRVSSQTPDGPAQLAKAAGYGKHGIDLISSMPKPVSLDDAIFTKTKNELLSMCHDGIGVAAVKTGKYDLAVAELTQSVQLSSAPDPVDYYLIGVSNEVGSHFTDASAAFTKCSTEGPMQAQCKAGLEDTKKKAKDNLEAPK